MTGIDPRGRLAYEIIQKRLRGLHIYLENYVNIDRDVVKTYLPYSTGPKYPVGFDFKTEKLYELQHAIAKHQEFGRDSPIIELTYGMLHAPNSSFREVGRTDSLHFEFRLSGHKLSQVHIDSVSIAVRREAKTGRVVYPDDLAPMFNHAQVDVRHRSPLKLCQ